MTKFHFMIYGEVEANDWVEAEATVNSNSIASLQAAGKVGKFITLSRKDDSGPVI